MIETVLVKPGVAGGPSGGGPHSVGPVPHPAAGAPPYRAPAPTIWSAPDDEDEDEDDGGPEWVRKSGEAPVR